MVYKYLCASPEGLVQQLAVSYIRHGYYWYVLDEIPAGKDPFAVDRKLIEKYGIAISVRERSRRKKAGIANVQYLRCGRTVLLVVTDGHHKIRQPCKRGGEKEKLRDCRRNPILFEGYSIGYKRSGVAGPCGTHTWHSHVRIDRDTYLQLKAFLLDRAMHRNVEQLSADFARIPYSRFAPVKRQLMDLREEVNEARSRQGYDPVSMSALKLRRKIHKPFERQEELCLASSGLQAEYSQISA